MILDGDNAVLGRLATIVAEKAMLGEQVDIINAEKIVITGNPKTTIAKYKQKRARHNVAKPTESTKTPRRPDLLVKRSIRGMIPHRTEKGQKAYKRIRVFMGNPKNQTGTQDSKFIVNPRSRKVTMLDICKELGWEGIK